MCRKYSLSKNEPCYEAITICKPANHAFERATLLSTKLRSQSQCLVPHGLVSIQYLHRTECSNVTRDLQSASSYSLHYLGVAIQSDCSLIVMFGVLVLRIIDSAIVIIIVSYSSILSLSVSLFRVLSLLSCL